MSETNEPSVMKAPKSLHVLVTGISGQQGGHVAWHLLKRGHHVRGLARNPENPKLTEVHSLGAEIVAGSFDDPATLEGAAKGIDAMFLMGTSFERGPQVETQEGKTAVDVAKKVGVPWLVYSSVASANRKTGIPHFESKFAVEEHLRQSGVPSVVSAPTSFMENVIAPRSIPGLKQGKVAGALSPSKPVQMVALQDLGSWVTFLIENPSRFKGKRFDVASDSLTNTDAVRILSEVGGRKFEYQQIPMEVMRSQSADYAKMLEWLERAGYTADIEGLRKEYPQVGWHRFREWAARQNWARILS